MSRRVHVSLCVCFHGVTRYLGAPKDSITLNYFLARLLLKLQTFAKNLQIWFREKPEAHMLARPPAGCQCCKNG